jgi:hypothetical protein
MVFILNDQTDVSEKFKLKLQNELTVEQQSNRFKFLISGEIDVDLVADYKCSPEEEIFRNMMANFKRARTL